MKIYEVLSQKNVDKIRNAFKIIRQYCKPFLNEIDNDIVKYPVYRGVESLPFSTIITKKTARLNDRKPLDTGEDTHKLINKKFIQKFGLPFRNGVFTTGNKNFAKGYGQPFLFFPIGDFKFIWSEEIRDLFSFLKRVKAHQPDFIYKKILEDIADLYTDTDLKAAIRSGNEIIFWVEEYYLVNSAYVSELIDFNISF